MNDRDGSPHRGSLPSPDEWRRLEPLVDAVLDAPVGQRASLLTSLSAGDGELRAQLEQLVAGCERDFPSLDGDAAQRFPAIFGDEAPPVPQTIAGRYRVQREIGRGGMAIVYLARDVKHSRDVAIKVVRPELTALLGQERFLREIEIAATLRHPNIVPLYDSGEERPSENDPQEGSTGAPMLYYVMPYETGHSLRERIAAEGPLPVQDTVVILHDVCSALAHAHRHGIVHRDIKPENILLAGRRAMIADFGVARAVSEAVEGDRADGLAFGTPAYMAPEQAARNATADHRADLYAAGVVAYELLAGRPPFDADVRRQPRVTHGADAMMALADMRSDVPPELAHLIAQSFAVDPDARWQSAEEMLAHLPPVTVAATATGSAPRPMRRRGWITSAAAAGLLAAAGFAVTRDRAGLRDMTIGDARQLTSEPGLEVQPSLSPDGRHVAYAAGHSLQMRIMVRPITGGRAFQLTPGRDVTEWLPHWSPDGARILFLANGGVFSAPAASGPAREEVAARPGIIITSAAWSPDGREIAYVRGDSLLALAVGTRRTRLIATGRDIHSCAWSPDARRLACVAGNSFYMTVGAIFGLGPMFANRAPSRIVVVPAAGGVPRSITDSASLHQSPAWAPDGRTLHYVSNRQGPRDVYAVDADAATSAGRRPVRLTTGIGAHSIAFSADGTRIVYAAYGSTANAWALPIPADGPASPSSAVAVTSGNQTVEGIRVSPDGRWLVYDSDLAGNSDVYRVPISGGEPERLTRSPLDEFRGVISPTATELVYHSYATGSRNLFLAPLAGGPARRLTHSSAQRSMANWSPDGTALALFDIGRAEALVMQRDAGGVWTTPRVVARNALRPEWSPDGRTIAYVSRSDGRIGLVAPEGGAQRDVYVPRAGQPLAELAIFSANGREIYFKSHDSRGRASFWSIPVTGGRPRQLVRFEDPLRASNRFDFASDGRRLYFTIEDRQSDIWVAEVTPR